MKTGRKGSAAAGVERPRRRSSLTRRSWSVPLARSTRPFACGLLAQRLSMLRSRRARPDCESWVDSGIAAGGVVPVEYDPLLGKISAWGEGRATAIARLLGALRDTAVLGPTTNLAFLQDVLAHPAFRRAATHTGFLAEHFATWQPGGDEAVAALAAALALTRSATSAGEARGRAAAPTPWETLGAWRLGRCL